MFGQHKRFDSDHFTFAYPHRLHWSVLDVQSGTLSSREYSASGSTNHCPNLLEESATVQILDEHGVIIRLQASAWMLTRGIAVKG
jgi:hypothetical protein